jgi:hypothetical protein
MPRPLPFIFFPRHQTSVTLQTHATYSLDIAVLVQQSTKKAIEEIPPALFLMANIIHRYASNSTNLSSTQCNRYVTM